MLDDIIKNMEDATKTKLPKGPVINERSFTDNEGRQMFFQTAEIPLKDYLDLIKDKAYEEGYSWGMQQTLDKIFGEEE